LRKVVINSKQIESVMNRNSSTNKQTRSLQNCRPDLRLNPAIQWRNKKHRVQWRLNQSSVQLQETSRTSTVTAKLNSVTEVPSKSRQTYFFDKEPQQLLWAGWRAHV